MNSNIIVLRNNGFSKEIDKNIPMQFIIKRDLVAINVSPRYNYMGIDYSKYNIDIGDEKMKFKINKNSKYSKLKEQYTEFDNKVNYDTCLNKCSKCCSDIFYITETEFFYILADYFINNKFIELYNVYKKALLQKEYLKENFAPLYKQMCDYYFATDERFDNLGMTVILDVSCPFLNKKGKCKCYDSRPIICRLYGTCYPCEHVNMGINSHQNIDINSMKLLPQNDKKQRRAIWYYLTKYLSKENLENTINKVKEFIEIID